MTREEMNKRLIYPATIDSSDPTYSIAISLMEIAKQLCDLEKTLCYSIRDSTDNIVNNTTEKPQ